MIKRIINYLKTNKEKVFVLTIGILSYIYYFNTLVTTYIYYMILFVFSLAVLLIFYFIGKINRSKLILWFLKTYLICYFIFYTILICWANTKEIETFNVPLRGYATSKSNAIYFRFKDYKFKRFFTLTKYPLENITEEYEVELDLRQPIHNVYFIDNIRLKKK